MDKKTTYYVIGAVILIVAIGIVIAVQNSGKSNLPVKTEVPEKAKTQNDVAREVGKELDMAKGEIPLRVTMDDNGQTASLTPGKNMVLMLGEEYNWDIKSSDEAVLAKRDVKLTDSRSQAVYQVAHSGKAVLSASGTCKSGSTCASQTVSFVLNVEGVITDDLPAADLVK